MLNAFRDGGWGMFPTLFFGVMMLVVAVRYATKPESRVIPLVASLGVLTLLAGALGFVTGIITTMKAVAHAAPGDRYIALIGLGESANNLALALLLAVLSMLAVVMGAWKLSRDSAPA
jgi:uncharacterized membrane protein YqjE